MPDLVGHDATVIAGAFHVIAGLTGNLLEEGMPDLVGHDATVIAGDNRSHARSSCASLFDFEEFERSVSFVGIFVYHPNRPLAGDCLIHIDRIHHPRAILAERHFVTVVAVRVQLGSESHDGESLPVPVLGVGPVNLHLRR